MSCDWQLVTGPVEQPKTKSRGRHREDAGRSDLALLKRMLNENVERGSGKGIATFGPSGRGFGNFINKGKYYIYAVRTGRIRKIVCDLVSVGRKNFPVFRETSRLGSHFVDNLLLDLCVDR